MMRLRRPTLERLEDRLTPATASLFKDIVPGPGSSYPGNLIEVNGTLFFSAFHPDTGSELWKSDGTEAGTVLVRDINPAGSSRFLHLFRGICRPCS